MQKTRYAISSALNNVLKFEESIFELGVVVASLINASISGLFGILHFQKNKLRIVSFT